MEYMKITKTYFSETAHIVRKAYSERCRFNVHGHSYSWNISLESRKLNEAGMVRDFGDLKAIKAFVDLFDHSLVLWQNETNNIKEFMNDHFHRVIIMKKNPTAENMARAMVQFTKDFLDNKGITGLKITAGVRETSTGYAESMISDNDDVFYSLTDELSEDLSNLMSRYWDTKVLEGVKK